MRCVWKYELDLVDDWQLRPMPGGATVVNVDMQNGRLCLWAEVDPSLTLVDRWFVVEGTGHRFEHRGRHLGTAHAYGDKLVWHVYEVTPTVGGA